VSESPASEAPQPTGRDYNLQILWPLARYVEDKQGAEALRKLAASAGVQTSDLDGKAHWASLECFEAFLAEARARLGDETFKVACAYRLREAYGPLRYLLWATSPAAVFRQAAKNYRMISRVGDLQIVSSTRNQVHTRFVSTRPFGRATCLMRHAQGAALPTLWGLPSAYVEERSCIGLGDPSCEFYMCWYEQRRWTPELAALLTAGLGMGAVSAGYLSSSAPLFLITALTGAIAYIYELRRTDKVNVKIREDFMGTLRRLAEEEANVRDELIALHQRQREWSRLLEQAAAEQAESFRRIAAEVESFQEERQSLLGFSHDLRNPLAVLDAAIEYVREKADALGPEGPSLAEDMKGSVTTMKRLVASLMSVQTERSLLVKSVPKAIEVPTIADRLRRRVKALAHGQDVRATVFSTREAPASIETDPVVFDRIFDNILANAVKYTPRGSIVVEVGGTPGYLVIKVSDTGRGIEPEQLEKVFSPRGSDPSGRAPDSYGVGLSVVVQLLGQMGGRLEVMSKPGVGTTLWVHIPERAVQGSLPERESAENLLSRVVKIRASAKLAGS
jgi:signal transduction histidine kinase